MIPVRSQVCLIRPFHISRKFGIYNPFVEFQGQEKWMTERFPHRRSGWMIGCQYSASLQTSTVVALLHLGHPICTNPHIIDIESNYYKTSELNNGLAQFTVVHSENTNVRKYLCVIYNFFVQKRETLCIKNWPKSSTISWRSGSNDLKSFPSRPSWLSFIWGPGSAERI